MATFADVGLILWEGLRDSLSPTAASREVQFSDQPGQ